ncbi:MAG: hypothetical protein SEPTF4163_003439 [Sporothrix epigloea]
MSDSEPSTQQEQPQQPAPVSAFPELRRRPKNIIKQIEDAAAFKSDSDVSNVAELPQLFWGDRRFVMEDHLYRSNLGLQAVRTFQTANFRREVDILAYETSTRGTFNTRE